MTTVLWMMTLQGLMGAFDSLWHHEVTERLPNKPSARGELEITDVNAAYLERQQLRVQKLGRGFAWFDTGTHDSLQDAAAFVRTIETRQDIKICCPEEIAFDNGYITADDVLKRADVLGASTYSDYLRRLVTGVAR